MQTIRNSLDCFLCMFKNYLLHNPRVWPKFCGRLYSKFSVQRLKSLNDVGFYHVATIFITIATVADFDGLVCFYFVMTTKNKNFQISIF